VTAKKKSYARRKGHQYERDVASMYRETGYSTAQTARSESGGMQEGTDILGLPWPVECKRRSSFSVREAARIIKETGGIVHVQLDRLPPVVVLSEEDWFLTVRTKLLD
jgi:hypothetical protein